MRAALASLAAAAVAAAFPAPAGSGDVPVPAAAPPPDGLLVLSVLSPERALVADPRTGAATGRELPGGTLCHGPVIVTGDRVLFFGLRRGGVVPRSAPLDGRGRAISLGAADTALPSSEPGRLWLGHTTSLRGTTMRMSLREVDAGGRVVARTSRLLPRWSRLVAVVDGGLLISRGRGLVLRAPRGDRLFIRGAWPLAAAGARVAWCTDGCRRLGIWSGESGGRALDPPPGLRPDDRGQPAFSPDGTRLALPVRTRDGGSRVAVVDLDANRWSVVPGARIAGYRAIAWSPSGRWLYFTGPRDRVLASRGGSERPVRLPIRTGGAVMSIASTAGSAAR